MTWVIIIGALAIAWLTLIWAFLSGAKKLNEKWDLDNRYAYERMRMDAKRRSLEAFARNAETPGGERELSSGGPSTEREVWWRDRGD